jgi:mono/diheme cytochrome c family protein
MKRIIILAGIVSIVLLAAYGGITLYDDNLKYGRMWETPAVKPYEEPILIMEAGVVPFTGGEAMFRTAAASELESPFEPDNIDTIVLGRKKYFTYCAQCHGVDHDGNGTVGQSFSPLPANLRSPRIQSLSGGALFKEISYGVPKGRQPPLATTIDISDRWRIIAYLKFLGPR